MKILVINGPNLNLLEKRSSSQYGGKSLADIENFVKNEFKEIEFDFVQSNLEGEIINSLQAADQKYSGIIINPGGYSHTSVAIRDAIELVDIPVVEVHLSNLASREDFRSRSITASKARGYVSGFHQLSYSAGVYILTKLVAGE